MKYLTSTILVETRNVPAGQILPGAKLQLVMTNLVTLAVSTITIPPSLTVVIGPMAVASRYRYEYQSVDSTGKVIAAYAPFESVTPGATSVTYQHITGVNLVWSDA